MLWPGLKPAGIILSFFNDQDKVRALQGGLETESNWSTGLTRQCSYSKTAGIQTIINKLILKNTIVPQKRIGTFSAGLVGTND